MPENIQGVAKKFWDEYLSTTSKKIKLIDAYLVYIVLTGVVQFLYCMIVGTFPFNSFLSGFISCVGSFVLAGMTSDVFHAQSLNFCLKMLLPNLVKS